MVWRTTPVPRHTDPSLPYSAVRPSVSLPARPSSVPGRSLHHHVSKALLLPPIKTHQFAKPIAFPCSQLTPLTAPLLFKFSLMNHGKFAKSIFFYFVYITFEFYLLHFWFYRYERETINSREESIFSVGVWEGWGALICFLLNWHFSHSLTHAILLGIRLLYMHLVWLLCA